jgi:hypothetical protein
MQRLGQVLGVLAMMVVTACGGSGGGSTPPPAAPATWVHQAGGVSDALSSDVATLADGSTYLAGYFLDEAVFGAGSPEETTLTSVGDLDHFVARYRKDGTLAWAVRDGGLRDDRAEALDVFTDGSCVVAGYRIDPVAGDPDAFTSRFAANGQRLWLSYGFGSGNDTGSAVVALADGTCVATGSFTDAATFGPGEAQETILTSSGGQHGFVARYAANGSLLWAVATLGSGPSRVLAAGRGPGGGVVVAGTFEGTVILGPGEAGEQTLVSTGGNDLFVAGYAADGHLAWAARDGGAGEDQVRDLATYADGSFVLAGASWDATGMSGGGWLQRRTAPGTLAWASAVVTPGADSLGTHVATMADGSCLLGGTFDGGITLGLGTATEAHFDAVGLTDLFYARFSGSGALRWARAVEGLGDSNGAAVGTHADGTIALAGYFLDDVTLGPGTATETSVSSPGGFEVFVARLGASGAP